MGTAVKHPVADQVKLSFVIFDIRALLTLRCERQGQGILAQEASGAIPAYSGLAPDAL